MRSIRLVAALASFLSLLSAGCEEGTPALPPAPTGPSMPIDRRVDWPSSNARGAVRALAFGDDGTLYLGGNFTRIGPTAGGGVPLHPDTGQPVAAFPKVNGLVCAATPDGSGGWYVGGEFSLAGGEPRTNLAHVLADGSLDATWAPQVTHAGRRGAVMALAFDGSTLYVGGDFDALSGTPRAGLGAIDLSGATTSWAPVLSTGDGTVTNVDAIALRGSEVLLGGHFDFVDGEPRRGLAAVGANGTLGAWNPSPSADVGRIAVVGELVYVAGGFDSVGGQPRAGLAALDAGGLATAWNPSIHGRVLALAADAGTLYVGGDFTGVAAPSPLQPGAFQYAARAGLAAFDASGALTDWSPGRGDSQVLELAAAGGVIYAHGYTRQTGWLSRRWLAAFDARGAPTAWDPEPDEDGMVWALAAGGGGVYVGGWFQWMGKATKRLGLAAVDPAGRVTDWNPGLAPVPDSGSFSGTVHALTVVGGTIYVGGDFTAVGGQPRKNLAAVDASGRVTAWNPAPPDRSTRSRLPGRRSTWAACSARSAGWAAPTLQR